MGHRYAKRYAIPGLLLVALLGPAAVLGETVTVGMDDIDEWFSNGVNKTALKAQINGWLGGILGGIGGSGNPPPTGTGTGTPPPPPPAPPLLGPEDPLCDLKFGGIRRSILMVADEGDFSGTSEAYYYKSAMGNTTVIPIDKTLCLYWSYGDMLGQPIVLAASGIGPVTTSVCITELMSCAQYVKELIYTGTSGWSPAVGGIMNPPKEPLVGSNPAEPVIAVAAGTRARARARASRPPMADVPITNGTCSQINNSTQKVRLGDICIFTHAINWECKQASWLDQCGTTGNQCYYPIEANGPASSFLFGQCIFDTLSTADISLANELLAATKTPLWNQKVQVLGQRRNTNLTAYEDTWWKNTAAGSGQPGFYPLPNYTVPYVFDYHTCTEVDGQFFYSGAPWEFVARQYAALNIASDNSTAGRLNATAKDVIAVAAMEAVGTLGALVQFVENTAAPRFPYALLRAASNYLMAPLNKTSPGVWNNYEPVVQEDFESGYGYAIASVSSAVLTTFALRCQAQYGANNTICDFTLDGYNPPVPPLAPPPMNMTAPPTAPPPSNMTSPAPPMAPPPLNITTPPPPLNSSTSPPPLNVTAPPPPLNSSASPPPLLNSSATPPPLIYYNPTDPSPPALRPIPGSAVIPGGAAATPPLTARGIAPVVAPRPSPLARLFSMFPGAAPATAPAAMGAHAEAESDLAGLPWLPVAQGGMSWGMDGAGALPDTAATAPVGAVPTAVPETPATAALPVTATVIPSAGAAMPDLAVGQIPATTALPADATLTPLAVASMPEAVGQLPMGAASAEGMSEPAGVMLPSDVPNTLPAQMEATDLPAVTPGAETTTIAAADAIAVATDAPAPSSSKPPILIDMDPFDFMP